VLRVIGHLRAEFLFRKRQGEFGCVGLEFQASGLGGGCHFLFRLMLQPGDFLSIAIGQALGFLLLLSAHLHFQIGNFGIEIGKALVDVGYAGVGIGFLSGGTGDTFLDGGIAFGQEGAAVFACQINQSAHEDDEVGPEPGAGTVLRFGTGVFGHLFGGGKREGEENE